MQKLLIEISGYVFCKNMSNDHIHFMDTADVGYIRAVEMKKMELKKN